MGFGREKNAADFFGGLGRRILTPDVRGGTAR
jgi:hypothetical protein